MFLYSPMGNGHGSWGSNSKNFPFSRIFKSLSEITFSNKSTCHSAKRGIENWDCMSSVSSVCLSVSFCVTMVDKDHISWKSWKLIARQLTKHLRSSWPKGHPPTSRGTWGNFRETRGGVRKSGVLEHKNGNISETRKDRLRWKVTMEEL